MDVWGEFNALCDTTEVTGQDGKRHTVPTQKAYRAAKAVWDRQMGTTKGQPRGAVTSKFDKKTANLIVANAHKLQQELRAYNDSIADSLVILGQQPQDIQGRDHELELLQAILERPITPVALLLGSAGSGKSALFEEFVKRNANGTLDSKYPVRYMPLALRLGEISALPANELKAALATLFGHLKDIEDEMQRVLVDNTVHIVLFIDEVHMLVTIFGAGTKVGGDVMKDMLARSPIRVVAATTHREFDSTIAVDKPLAERFKVIELAEVGPEIVHKIAVNWWQKVAVGLPPIDEKLIDYVIQVNHSYRPDQAEPRKTLDTLEDLVSYERRTGLQPTESVVDQLFQERFSIELKFNIDADVVMKNVRSQVKGQPAALESLDLAIHTNAFKLRQNANKPIFTALFTGPTGVGKSQTTKAIAEVLYPGQNVLVNVNMPDYALNEQEPSFRKRIGETLRHHPNAVLLLDEMEKAAPNVKRSLLAILDEGLVRFTVTNREGRDEEDEASLRNAIVICTTNAGARVFADDQKHGRSTSRNGGTLDYQQRSEVDRLLTTLRHALVEEGDFPPETLGRFDQLVPYRALDEQTSLDILDKRLMDTLNSLRDLHHIQVNVRSRVTWDPQQYDCYANDVVVYLAYIAANIRDSNAGGARALMGYVNSVALAQIVRAVSDNPNCNEFDMYVPGVTQVTRADGQTVYHMDNEVLSGVKVEPTRQRNKG